MKFNKIILSALLVFSMFNIQLNNEVEAKESVVIDEGTDTAFTVPADSSKVVEAGLEDGFVQGDSVKYNFEKQEFEGLELPYHDDTEILDSHTLKNGNTIVVLLAHRHTGIGSFPSSRARLLRQNDGKGYGQQGATFFILLVGKDGVIIRSSNVRYFGEESMGEKTGGIASVTYITHKIGSEPSYYPYKRSNPEFVRVNFNDDKEVVSLSFRGGVGRTSAEYENGNFVAEAGYSLEEPIKYDRILPSAVTSYDGIFNYGEPVSEYNEKTGTYNFNGEHFYQHERVSVFDEDYPGEAGKTGGIPYRLIDAKDSNNKKNGNVTYLNIPKAQEALGVSDEDVDRYKFGPVIYGGVGDLSDDIGWLSNVTKLPNGSYFTVASYAARKGVLTSNMFGTTSLKDVYVGDTIEIWDHVEGEKGDVMIPKFSYVFEGDDLPVILYDISSETEIFFMDSEKLKKINVNTGEVTTLQTFPVGSTIDVQNDSSDNSYMFSGYAGSNTGILKGYGYGAGAVVGTMDANFNIESANIIHVDSNVEMNLTTNSNGDMFVMGGLDDSKTFANAPTAETNAAINGGRPGNKPEDKGTYYGSLKGIDDYSPAINVGNDVVLNIKDYSTEQEAVDAIISDVKVYDTYELHDKNPSNAGLSDEQRQEKFNTRLNKNPYDLNADTNWNSLGLDTTKIGYNNVKMFISDTNNQVTADSKVVNIIADSTIQNGKVALDASNFHIEKSEAASLDLAKAKTNANATAWDMLDGTNLDSSITVNAGELAAINTATEDGVYNLTFTATNGTDSISNTIKVYVGGNYDPNSKVVLFGNDFGVLLEEAPTYTEAEALVDSDARAYNIETEELLDKDNLSADVAAINAATKSGIYAASVSYNDTNVSLTDDVNVRICTATCVDIVANHFNLTINEVASLTEEKIIALAGAKAHDLITGDKHNISVDFGKIHAMPGSYDVTFTSKNNSSITVKATVGNNLVTDDTRAIAADDVVMSAKELKALKNDRDALNAELLDRSNARAWIIETNETLDGIVVDSNSFDFADLKADTYKIKYTHIDTATSNPITTSANLTVDDGGTVIGDYDVIDANDFALAASEVEGLTEEKVIELAHARAWLLEDGSDVKITDVDYSNIEAKQGIYDVTFTSEYGTSTTIYAFVGKDNRPIIDEDKNIVVFANDYSVDTKNLDGMTKTDHIEAANAMAVDKDTHEELELSHVDISSIKNEAGEYSASFGVDISKTKTKSTDIVKSVVTVTVVDSSTDGGLVQTGMVSYAFALALLACGLLLVRREKNRKRV